MIVDLMLMAWLSLTLKSWAIFWILLVIAFMFRQPGSPFASGILRFTFIALGISFLFGLFGGDDCDFDV
ncbi:MAG: hypothetical protein ACKN9W_13720 [Methylococcus sp.]